MRANVSGLAGAGLSLSLNGGTAAAAQASGPVDFTTRLSDGQSYAVTVSTQPSNPRQNCRVAAANGVVRGADIVIAVSCIVDEPTSIRAAVSIDPAEPASLANKIVAINSALGATSGPGELEIPWGPEAAIGYVFATDANDEIVLAGLGDRKPLALSAETTAVALVRLMIDEINESLGSAEAAVAIRATSGFTGIVTAIRNAHATSVALSDSEEVIRAVNVVIGQLPASMRAVQVGKGGPVVMREIVDPRVGTTPFQLVSHLGLAVSIIGGSNGGGAEIRNLMPIAWQAKTLGPNAEVLCASSSDCGFIERYTLLGKDVPGNGAAFNLFLQQTAATREANVRHVVGEVIDMAFEAVFKDKSCRQAVVKALLSPNALVEALNDRSETRLRDFFLSITVDHILNALKSTAGGCIAIQRDGLPQHIRVKLKFVFKRLNAFLNGVQVVDLGLTLAYTSKYWDVAEIPAGICLSKGILFGYNVAGCAESMAFNPTDIYFAPGVTAPAPYPAFRDGNNRPTAAASKLIYTPATPGIVSIDAGGNITAGPITGVTSVNVRDEISGLSSSFNANVVLPVISPLESQRYPGESVIFSLTSENKQPIQLPPDTSWELQFPGGATSHPDFTIAMQGYGGAIVQISPQAALGTQVLVIARCATCITGIFGTAKFGVVDDVPNIRLEYVMPPDKVTNGSYGLWGSAFFGSQGPQCIGGEHSYRIRIYNRSGVQQSDRSFSGTASICPNQELGWWPKRTDGRHWGLIISGGVGSGGRELIEGTITLRLPNSRSPQTVPSTHTYTCNVTEDGWSCGGT